MFAGSRLQSLICQVSIRYSSSFAKKKVFVSQSRDLLSNIALEDWAVKNMNFKDQSLLVLSNNLTKTPGVDIKATLLDTEVFWKVEDFNKLVLGSVPPDLPLESIPDLEASVEQMDSGSQAYSLHLKLSSDVKTKIVLKALETIGNNFLGKDEAAEPKKNELARINLVRPDDGWFPGLEKVRVELEERLAQVDKMHKIRSKKKREKSVSSDYNHVQNSFGQ